jgi:hypothetical protein
MKARILALSTLMICSPLIASETFWTDAGKERTIAYTATPPTDDKMECQKDAKIGYLTKMLDQQQKMYESKIGYLEFELKKSKERLVEKSINNEKAQTFLEEKFAEETSNLKKELVAKTKTNLEYQRQLEKIKPSEEMKNLIKVNTELAIEVRKSTDQIALMQLKHEENKGLESFGTTGGGRMPASVGK